MQLFRFELAFDGEPQEVGLMQGLDDIGLCEEVLRDIEDAFSDLPCPHLTQPCSFWFTEIGVLRFKSVLDSVIGDIAENSWQLLGAVLNDPDMDKAIYQDKYQVAFSPEYVHSIGPQYKELNRLDELVNGVISTQMNTAESRISNQDSKIPCDCCPRCGAPLYNHVEDYDDGKHVEVWCDACGYYEARIFDYESKRATYAESNEGFGVATVVGTAGGLSLFFDRQMESKRAQKELESLKTKYNGVIKHVYLSVWEDNRLKILLDT